VREADVVLSDAGCPPPEGRPVIALGSPEADQAGSLDRKPTPAQIDAALRAVVAGLVVRSPGLAPAGFAPLYDDVLDTLLTPREVDVLKCIGEGLTNKLIARRLDISLHTVKFHIESLLRKLGATTRAQALAKALERRRLGTMEF
jgi:DNA-binding NarL/FixJ family response regulator